MADNPAGLAYFQGQGGVQEDAVHNVLRLNFIIAEVLFHEGKSGEPVHLDLDEDSALAIEEKFGLDRNEFSSLLVDSVCNIASSSSPAAVFGIFAEATRRWNNRRMHFAGASLDIPPALSLLGLLSLAAELMRPGSNEDDESEGISAAAYYARLKELVNRPEWSVVEIQREYRDKKAVFEVQGPHISRAVGLWRSLDSWLSAWEDERGICTVSFPAPGKGGRWAVDMPISQALLREADRENLRKMFGFRNLDPSVPVSEEMMFVLIDEWCTSYGTTHLKGLWKHADYRESVTGAALNTLVSWTGVTESPESGSNATAVGVGLTLDLNAFTRRVDIGVEIRTGVTNVPESIDIVDENGGKIRTRLQPGGPRTARVADYSAFDAECLVSGVLKVSNDDINLVGRRYPRPVVPFLASSAGNSYAEVSTMTLSARHGVLVRAMTDDNHDLLADVTELLAKIARPGWRVVDSARFTGIPNGWVFIQNVELVSYPSENLSRSHLVALTPLPTESMSLSGGFRVPGRRERWLACAPPSVLAVFPFETSVIVSVQNSAGNVVHSVESENRVAVLDLAQVGLVPGTYLVEATPSSGLRLRKTLYLVDADSPNPSAFMSQHALAHPISNHAAFGVISAQEIDEIDVNVGYVRGLDLGRCGESSNLVASSSGFELPVSRQWIAESVESSREVTDVVRIERAPAGSCLVNRSHYWVLATAGPGAAPKFVEGRCKFCQIIKLHHGIPVVKSEFRRTRRVTVIDNKLSKQETGLSLTKEVVAAIPPIETREDGLWDHAFQAVCYLRFGSISDLASIVGQVGGGSIGVDRIVRSLGALGHVDVQLDLRCRPKNWSIGPAVAVATSDVRAHLAGFRSTSMVSAITRRVEEAGGYVSFLNSTNSPRTVELNVPAGTKFEDVLNGVVDPVTGTNILVQRDATRVLLRSLPSITAVSEACPWIPRPSSRKLNKWNGAHGRWEQASSDLEAGAYQNIGNGYVYTFHKNNINLGDELQSGTASTVKHQESLRAGVPLFFYSSEARVLCLKLGAELPGLYGRAVVALSGRAPDEDEFNSLVKYHDVDEPTARDVHRLLRN